MKTLCRLGMWIVLPCGLLLVSSCASIISTGTQKVPVKSEPSEASVKVFDKKGELIETQTTPCILTLKRGTGFFQSAKYRLVIEKQGYVAHEVKLTGNLNGWYLGGNFLLGGLIGWVIVDPLTGAMWTLNPSEIRIDFKSPQGRLLPSKDGLHILLSSQLPQEYHRFMRPIMTPES